MDNEYPNVTFENRMRKIENDIKQLGDLAIKSNEEVISLINAPDETLYEAIAKRSGEIDLKAVNLERDCITFMATEKPVAHDLIFVESSIRIISHIKRIGRLLMKISQSLKNIQDIEITEKTKTDLDSIAKYVKGMLEKSIEAFLNEDIQKARELTIDDDEVDDLYDSILEQSMIMIENSKSVPKFMDLIMIARNFERIADKTVNIGSRIVFMQTLKRPDIEQ